MVASVFVMIGMGVMIGVAVIVRVFFGVVVA